MNRLQNESNYKDAFTAEALFEAASCACALLDSEAFNNLFECGNDNNCLLNASKSAYEELHEAGSDLSLFVRIAYLHSTNEKAAAHFGERQSETSNSSDLLTAKHGTMLYQTLMKREPTTDKEKQMLDLICSAFSECFA